MSLSLRDILGLKNRFGVTIDGTDLGMWGSCNGLEVDFKPEPIEQGGVYDYKVILPGQLSYGAVTLKRAVTPQDSKTVQTWLQGMVSNWVQSTSQRGAGGTAVITLYSSEGAPVISWSLRNVYPSKWTGPELDAASMGIAMETLQLVHEGFL